ncbi:obstructor B1 [Octopus vulgaris]|uniref:Obstructor B1 n=1 Tax=Octopus vulgaris TaxID=6645 RepID=A0AA36C1B2_OCTVU|nr:obstructor B1 [Octopus vulgaris]
MVSYIFLLILSGSILASGQPCGLPPYVQIADASNCHGFLQCINNQVQHRVCVDGTLFNALTGLCDFPFNVDCGYRPNKGPVTVATTAFPTTTQSLPTTMSPVKKEILRLYDFWYGFHCNLFGTTSIIRWPHPYDCTKYFECEGKTLSRKTCPSSPGNLFFQFEPQNCVIEKNANCPLTPPFGEKIVPSPEEVRYQKICRTNPNSLMRWPYSRDCRRYFQCTYGKFTQEICPQKPNVMVYNDEILNCQSPQRNNTCILTWRP